LPLHSGCWRLVRDVYKQLKEEHSDPDIMLLDLFEAMDDGRVGYKFRQTVGGRKQALESPGWLSEWERNSAPDDLSDVWVQRLEESGILRQARSGVVFYVWEPDLVEKLWPPCEERAESEPETGQQPEKPPRRPPGPTPRYDWRILIARELIRRAKAEEKDPTATKMIELCAKSKLDYQPRLRSVQELLKQLLG
jgi:hypothetical protein